MVIEKILTLLNDNNKTQHELANYLGISDTVFSSWKKGMSHSYYSYISEICAFFNTEGIELYKLMEVEKTKPKQYIVYKHTSPSGKIYIGITETKGEKRWKSGQGYKNNDHFYNAIKKYGWKNFKHEILFKNLTQEEAIEKEIELIKYYHSDDRNKGYNVSPGGSLVSEGSKDKIRKSRKAKGLNIIQANRTKKLWSNPEWRKSTVKRMQGKKRTEEQKKNYKIGRAKQPPISEETRKKISESLSKKTGEASIRKKAVLQIEPVTMKVLKRFATAREAAAYVGVSINAIATICRRDINSNKSRASHHYFWCYEDDYNSKDFEIYRGIHLTKSGKLPRTGRRASWYGRMQTESAKEKISLAHSIPVMCLETGKVYLSTTYAGKEYGVSASAINKCARGINKTCAGLHWKYIE